MPNPESRVDPASEEEFLAQLYKGGELLAAGNVAEAKNHLERAYTLHPKNEKAQNLLGLTYFKLGIYDRAAHLYEKLVLDNPADPTLRVNLGLVYLKSNDLQRCIREFETATDLSPEHKKAQNYLGLALAQAGEYARAREHFVLAGSEVMAEKMAKAVAAGAPPPKKVTVSHDAPLPPPPPRRGPDEVQIEVMSEENAPREVLPPMRASAPPPPPPPQDDDEVQPPQRHDRTQHMFVPPEPMPEEAPAVVEVAPDEEVSPPERHDRTQHMFVVPETLREEEPPPAPSPSAPTVEADDVVEVIDPVPTSPPVITAAPALSPLEEIVSTGRVATPIEEAPRPPPLPEPTAPSPPPAAADDEMRFAEDEGPPAPPMPEELPVEPPQVLPEMPVVQVVDEMPVVEATADVQVEVYNQAELPTPRAWDEGAAPVEELAVPADTAPQFATPSSDEAAYEQAPAEPQLDAYAEPPAVEQVDAYAEQPSPDQAAADFLGTAEPSEQPAEEPIAESSQEVPPVEAQAEVGAAGEEEPEPMPSWLVGGESANEQPPAAAENWGEEAQAPEPLEPPPPPENYGSWGTPVLDAATPVETPAVSPDGSWDTPATGIEAAAPEHERALSRQVTAQVQAVAGPPHVDFVPDAQPLGIPEPPVLDPSYAAVVAPRLAEIGPSLDWSRSTVTGPFLVNKDGLALQVHGELLSRLTGIVAVVGSIDAKPENRRMRGRASDQPFGEGGNQLQRVTGEGMLYLEPGRARFHAINLADDAFYVKEELVFAFEEAVAFENGKLTADKLVAQMLHLKGEGQVLLRLEGELKTMGIPTGSPLVVPLNRLVGWYGMVNPRLKGLMGQGAIELNGEGYALLVAPS